MKKNKLKLCISFCCVMLIVASFIAVFVVQNKDNTIGSQKIVVDELSSRTFYQLVQEINSFEPELEDTVLIYYAESLVNASKDVSLEQIEQEITNAENCTTLRVLLLQICDELDLSPDEEMLQTLIKDENTDFEIKRNSMYLLDGTDEVAELIEIARGDDERLAFHAIRELLGKAPMQAGEIADEIISAYDGTFTFKTRGAVIAKANQLGFVPDEKEIDDFLVFCDTVLQQYRDAEDQTAAGIVTHALTSGDYLTHEKVLRYLVDCEWMNPVSRSVGIENHKDVMLALIGEDMSEEQLSYIIKAVEINPLSELSEPLQEIAETYSFSAASNELQQNLQEVIGKLNETKNK